MPLLSLLTLGSNSLLFTMLLHILKEVALQEAPVIEADIHAFLSKHFPNIAAHGSPAQLTTIASHTVSLLGAIRNYLHGAPTELPAPPVQ